MTPDLYFTIVIISWGYLTGVAFVAYFYRLVREANGEGTNGVWYVIAVSWPLIFALAIVFLPVLILYASSRIRQW